VAPTAKGYGEGIVQTTNADKAAAKVEVVRKSAPRKGVGVRVPPSALPLNFPSKINTGRSLHLGRSYLIFVSPSMAQLQTEGNASAVAERRDPLRWDPRSRPTATPTCQMHATNF
jgi:hypothetical protein